MVAFVAAYLLVLLSLVLYVVRLGKEQRRLGRELDVTRARLEEFSNLERPVTRAA